MKLLLDFTTAAQEQQLFDYSFYDCIIHPLTREDVEIKVIVNETLYQQIKFDKKYAMCEFLPVKYDDYIKYGYSFDEVVRFLFSGENAAKYMSQISSIYIKLLGDYQPEVIINFELGNCVLKKLYPDALNLVYNGGLWKSIPPNFSMHFDPINTFSFSSLVKFANEIKNFKITAEQNEKIKNLKSLFRNKIISTKIARKVLLRNKKKYRKLILLPLQVSGNNFILECDFKTQREYFEYVIDKIPSDIGIIVTGHLVNLKEIKNMVHQNKEKYKNVIFIDELFKYSQASMFVLPYVDAMINVSSSLVLKAMLADVKIISLGKHYNSWFENLSGLENMEQFLNECNSDRNNNILYWFLTRYDINSNKVKQKDWLFSYINTCYSKRHNINIDYFNEIISIDEVTAYFEKINYCKKVNSKLRFLLNNIFSIKNTGTKVKLIILGIKLSFKVKEN